MTPLQIKMMLHYYTSADPYAKDDPWHASSDAVSLQRTMLVRDGLLGNACGTDWVVTDRGRAYVEALCNMPLPVKKWVMPDAA